MCNKIFIMLFFILFGCNENNKDFFLIERNHITENDTTIIVNINNINFDSKSERILISDYRTNIVYLYDLKTNQFISKFISSHNLSDSIALNYTPFNENSIYLTTMQFIKQVKGQNIEMLTKALNNTFYNGVFTSDKSIAVASNLGIIIEDKNRPERNQIGLDINYCIIEYDLEKNEYQVIRFEKSSNFAPRNHLLYYLKERNQYLIDCGFYNSLKNLDNINTYSISAFSKDGKFIKPLCTIPKEYFKSGLGYSYANPYLLINLKGELVCCYPFTTKIYNISTLNHIEMKELPATNDIMFNILENNRDTLFKNPKIVNNFPIRINNLLLTSNGNYLISLTFTRNDTIQYYLFEYSTGGEFICKNLLEEETNYGKIKYITYSKHKKSVMVLRKSNDKGWFYEYWRRL